MIRARCHQIALALALLMPSGQLSYAQMPEPPTSGTQLQQLIDTEQSALDANDPTLILRSGKQLGSFALRLLGSLYTEQNKCALAGEAYQQSISLQDTPESLPDRVQSSLHVLTSDLCANNRDATKSTVEQILHLAGDTAQAHLLIANAYHRAADLPGTIAELSRAVSLDPESAPAHLALANAFWELNEYQYNPDTLREFATAKRINPKDFYANQSLGAVLSQYERYEEAALYLQKAVAADPSSPDPLLLLGMNAYAQDHLDEAVTALQQAVALTGQDEARNGFQIRRAYAALSRIKQQQGLYVEAQEDAQHEAALHTQILKANFAAPLSESAGMIATSTQKAMPLQKASLPVSDSQVREQQEVEKRLNGIIAKSLNDAGTVLARERNYEAALPLFRLASTSDPDLQPIMRNLGLAAFHTEDYRTAIQALSRALEQHPEDTLIRTDLERSRAGLLQTSRSPQP